MCILKSLDFFQAVGAASLWMDKYQFMFLKSFNNIIVNEKWKSRQKKKSSSTIGRYSFAEFNWNRMSTMTTDNNIDRPAIPKPIKTFIVHSDLIRWFHLLNFLILFTFRLFICCHIRFDLIRFDFISSVVPTMERRLFSHCNFFLLSCVYFAICHIFMRVCTKWYFHFDVCFGRWVGWLLYYSPRYFKAWRYQSTFRTNVAIQRYDTFPLDAQIKFIFHKTFTRMRPLNSMKMFILVCKTTCIQNLDYFIKILFFQWIN